MKYELFEDEKNKIVRAIGYNYNFSKITGAFMRWGETTNDDPTFSPFGPEILDIEISTICHQNCSFCYKSNTSEGQNMSLETFKKIFHKIPRNLTQIAFGIGDIHANPDLYSIMSYCRSNDYNRVVPNITINGAQLVPEDYYKLSKLCGAVAVSNYSKNACYDAVQRLGRFVGLDRSTLRQVNIHQLLCEETYDKCISLMDDMQTDERLYRYLNATVFLIMKPKGKRNIYTPLKDMEKYKALINKALDKKLPIGFDSCTAPSFMRAIESRPEEKMLKQCAEPCESTIFSLYINTRGECVPCSFSDGEKNIDAIDMLKVEDFMTEVWNAPQLLSFRDKLLSSEKCNGCRTCPLFDVEIQ